MQFKKVAPVIPICCFLLSAAWADEFPGVSVSMPEARRDFFKSYCIRCHNADKRKGDLLLDGISFKLDSVENAERWQKILNQLNSGNMPPEEAEQPDKALKTEFLDVLAQTLVQARKALSDSGGRITMRRLNRREYKNTIRDLLGVELNARDLPDDRGVGGFDTVGASLFMSSDQFEQYFALGRQALDEAFVRRATGSSGTVQRCQSYHRETEDLAKQNVRAVFNAYYLGGYKMAKAWQASDRSKPPSEFGLADETEVNYRIYSFETYGPSYAAYLSNPLSDTGSLLTGYSAEEEVIALPPDTPSGWDKTVRDPVPSGNYLLKMRIGATSATPGERHFVEMGTRAGDVKFAFQRSFEITGTVDQPQIIEALVSITADGPRSFVFRERRPRIPGDVIFLDAIKRTGVIPDPAIWIDWIEWDGPLPTPTDKDPWGQILVEKAAGASESEHARNIIERFATRAFRDRKPEADFVERLLGIYERHRKAERSFEEALKEPLSVVLSSPGFLYLSEPSVANNPRELTPDELASRLSYFLWSAPPDEPLLALARSGDLQKPEVLAEQVDRMIADEKVRAFITGFTHQWLGMERLDFFQFNPKLYGDFDESTKAAAKEELFYTVEHLVRHQGSLRALLKSDFVVINGLLAHYYGIEGVTGDEFRRVSLPADSPRGGLLGMAAILAMGSNGETTSPVERGAWVLRKLLNDPPPPAPPNVPQLARMESQLLTTRERILAHQEEPQCASCHRKIDPIGFGLENFNAAGKWRTEDRFEKAGVGEKSWRIDPAGAFYDGPAFQDYFELRERIAARVDDFARGFTEALIEYSLGRPYGFVDEALAARVVARAKESNFAMQEFIHSLVGSRAFRRK
jgi:hypothetical protein